LTKSGENTGKGSEEISKEIPFVQKTVIYATRVLNGRRFVKRKDL
jgi:hypothetical protein